jgi:hypothetical protein
VEWDANRTNYLPAQPELTLSGQTANPLNLRVFSLGVGR